MKHNYDYVPEEELEEIDENTMLFMKSLTGDGSDVKSVVRRENARLRGETTSSLQRIQYNPNLMPQGIQITEDSLTESIMEVMNGITREEARRLSSFLYNSLARK